MPGTVKVTLSLLILPTSREVGTMLMNILQMKKLKHRKFK